MEKQVVAVFFVFVFLKYHRQIKQTGNQFYGGEKRSAWSRDSYGCGCIVGKWMGLKAGMKEAEKRGGWSRNEDQGQPMTERVSVEEEGFSQAGH